MTLHDVGGGAGGSHCVRLGQELESVESVVPLKAMLMAPCGLGGAAAPTAAPL